MWTETVKRSLAHAVYPAAVKCLTGLNPPGLTLYRPTNRGNPRLHWPIATLLDSLRLDSTSLQKLTLLKPVILKNPEEELAFGPTECVCSARDRIMSRWVLLPNSEFVLTFLIKTTIFVRYCVYTLHLLWDSSEKLLGNFWILRSTEKMTSGYISRSEKGYGDDIDVHTFKGCCALLTTPMQHKFLGRL